MQQSIVFIRNEFERRLDADQFNDLAPHVLLTSICQFIDHMTFGNFALDNSIYKGAARFPELTDLNIKFSEFLRMSIRVGTRRILISDLIREDFCRPVVMAIITKAKSDRLETNCPVPMDGLPVQESVLSLWSQWAIEMQKLDRIETLVNACFDSVVSKLSDRTLLSFFIRPPVPGEFTNWGPYASTGHGRKLPTRVIDGEGYSVTVACSRYPDLDVPVTAYEWEARLTTSGAVEHDAVACGMVYVFDRMEGSAIAEMQDLIIASSTMADVDVLQAAAFADQHPDAVDIIERSDLCFVWMWERKGNAEKGVGAKCLTAALQDLRRRFKKLSTAVINIEPTQFKLWDAAIDPPMVAVEKQTAIENIINYIRSIKDIQHKFDTRPIFVRSQNPRLDASAAVAIAEAKNNIEDGDEDANFQIDIVSWRAELISLFDRVGLDDLAGALEDEVESYQEVELALKHLVFEHQVNYMRLPASSEFSTDAFSVEYVSSEDAYDNGAFARFEDELPDDMEVVGVWRDDEYDDDQLICEVHAHTPFGTLREFFVLIPKPRQFNIETFFRDIRD